MKTAIALLALAVSAGAYGSDVHLELGAVMTRYGIQSDGIWYQLGMPHRLELNGRAFELGATGDAYASDNWGVAWHADYVNLGQLRSQCSCTTIDADYSTQTRSLVGRHGYVPVANYAGHGSVQGLKFSLAPYMQLGSWRVGAEAGLFPYRPDWQMTVSGWHVSPDGPFKTGSHNTPHTLQLGKMFGAFVQRDRLTVSYEFYRLPTRFDATHNPALFTGAHMLMVSYEL